MSETYRPAEFMLPTPVPASTTQRKCGCPEQHKGRYCPACHGTGWIPPTREQLIERLRAALMKSAP